MTMVICNEEYMRERRELNENSEQQSLKVQMTFIGIKSIYRILFFGRTRVFSMRQPFRCVCEFDLPETENALSIAA